MLGGETSLTSIYSHVCAKKCANPLKLIQVFL